MKKILALSLLAVLGLAGCTNWERNTFQTLSASKATIDQAQADYESGKLPHTQAVYDAVTKAKAAQKTAVDAFLVYEGAKANGTSGDSLATAQSAVVAAISALPAIIADIRALYTVSSLNPPQYGLYAAWSVA